MMKTILKFLLLIFFSCSSKEQTISYPLVYTPPKTLKEKILFQRSSLIPNEILTLNKDKTYSFETCTQFNKGTWERREDSLFLKCTKKGFFIDSLNFIEKYKYLNICSSSPSVWIVKRKGIYRELTYFKKNERKKQRVFLINRN
ncbi:hypothetical protein P3875_04020 [Myroides sp. JBRI-B21084]|uniref:hypothetical protein n=1 Tax=Myroides sp. JBRI-B21084 TaxID=3119977 RepID=UPI0026E2DA88|nr:hypothetical protein [Paenimyroides cloacae]WKW47238.1 hypothetical protein P3875_04020 [Paenimyroides cloacae]